jgi:hypothetical protein
MDEDWNGGLGRWQWRNLRDFGLGLRIWPLNWRAWEFAASGDRFGARYVAQVGPVELTLDVNDGSWRAKENG